MRDEVSSDESDPNEHGFGESSDEDASETLDEAGPSDTTDSADANGATAMSEDRQGQITTSRFFSWQRKVERFASPRLPQGEDHVFTCSPEDVVLANVSYLIEEFCDKANEETHDMMKEHGFDVMEVDETEIHAIILHIVESVEVLEYFLNSTQSFLNKKPDVGGFGRYLTVVLYLINTLTTVPTTISERIIEDLRVLKVLTLSFLYRFTNLFVRCEFGDRDDLIDVKKEQSLLFPMFIASRVYLHINSLYHYYMQRVQGAYQLPVELLDSGFMRTMNVLMKPDTIIPTIAEYQEVVDNYDEMLKERIRPLPSAKSNGIKTKPVFWGYDLWKQSRTGLSKLEFHWARTIHIVQMYVRRNNAVNTRRSKNDFQEFGARCGETALENHTCGNVFRIEGLGVTPFDVPNDLMDYKRDQQRHRERYYSGARPYKELPKKINNVYVMLQLSLIFKNLEIVTQKTIVGLDAMYVKGPYLKNLLRDTKLFLEHIESSLTTKDTTEENKQFFQMFLDHFPTMLGALMILFSFEIEKFHSHNEYDEFNEGAFEDAEYVREGLPDMCAEFMPMMDLYDVSDELYRYIANYTPFRSSAVDTPEKKGSFHRRAHILDDRAIEKMHVYLSIDPRIKEYDTIRKKYDDNMRLRIDIPRTATRMDIDSHGRARERSPERPYDGLRKSHGAYVARAPGQRGKEAQTHANGASGAGLYVVVPRRVPPRKTMGQDKLATTEYTVLQRNERKEWNELLGEIQDRNDRIIRKIEIENDIFEKFWKKHGGMVDDEARTYEPADEMQQEEDLADLLREKAKLDVREKEDEEKLRKDEAGIADLKEAIVDNVQKSTGYRPPGHAGHTKLPPKSAQARPANTGLEELESLLRALHDAETSAQSDTKQVQHDDAQMADLEKRVTALRMQHARAPDKAKYIPPHLRKTTHAHAPTAASAPREAEAASRPSSARSPAARKHLYDGD